MLHAPLGISKEREVMHPGALVMAEQPMGTQRQLVLMEKRHGHTYCHISALN